MVQEQDLEKQEVRATTEQEKKILNHGGVMVRFATEPNRLNPKTKTIFPERRRLVKSMILDSILKFFCCGSTSKAQKGGKDYRF